MAIARVTDRSQGLRGGKQYLMTKVNNNGGMENHVHNLVIGLSDGTEIDLENIDRFQTLISMYSSKIVGNGINL